MRTLHIRKQWIVFFVPGFLFGVLYVNIFAKQSVSGVRIFSSYFLKQYMEMDVTTREYLPYLLKIRALPFLCIMALTFTRVRKIASALILVWTGFSAGMLLSLAVWDMGMKGIILCMIGVFPHCLFYAMSYAVLLIYSWRYPKNQWNHQKTIFVMGMMTVGILLELWMSPYIVRMFLQVTI